MRTRPAVLLCVRVPYPRYRWTQYKIDHKRDKVGVFVSIVSTRIPFKVRGRGCSSLVVLFARFILLAFFVLSTLFGSCCLGSEIVGQGTGKEYIGDDVEEIAKAVKSALQACCAQLRTKLVHRSEMASRASRRKALVQVCSPHTCVHSPFKASVEHCTTLLLRRIVSICTYLCCVVLCCVPVHLLSSTSRTRCLG